MNKVYNEFRLYWIAVCQGQDSIKHIHRSLKRLQIKEKKIKKENFFYCNGFNSMIQSS
jgi:hypothetical protein